MADLPSLNMVGWGMDDFEAANEGVGLMQDSILESLNGEAALGSDGNYRPGAKFLAARLNELDHIVEQMAAQLRTTKFITVGEDDRRLALLLKIEMQDPDFSLSEFCRKA